MPAIQTTRMTARQYFQLGEDPDGIRLELVDGQIEMSPSPTPGHSHAAIQLAAILVAHVTAHDLGAVLLDLDTELDEHNVRRPDVLFFAKPREHLVGEERLLGPPDLAVEVVSPGSQTTDRRVKFRQHADDWIVDPRPRTMEAYTLDGGVYRLTAEGRGDDVVTPSPFETLDLPLANLWR